MLYPTTEVLSCHPPVGSARRPHVLSRTQNAAMTGDSDRAFPERASILVSEAPVRYSGFRFFPAAFPADDAIPDSLYRIVFHRQGCSQGFHTLFCVCLSRLSLPHGVTRTIFGGEILSGSPRYLPTHISQHLATHYFTHRSRKRGTSAAPRLS